MPKKYIVRLTDAERQTLNQIVAKFKGSSQRVRRAQVLLKADVDGPGWTDERIAEAYGCRRQTVENIRERVVTEGFELTLNGKPRPKPLPGRCSMVNKKRRSSPCVWDRHRRGLRIGRCGCWPNRR